MSNSKSEPVAILGAGAWGLSTALHLADAGYSDISVYDRATEIPSTFSGAYDLNKIVRAEYEDRFYTDLALVNFLHRRLFRLTHSFHRKPSTAGRHRSGEPISTRLVTLSLHRAPLLQRPLNILKQRYNRSKMTLYLHQAFSLWTGLRPSKWFSGNSLAR